MSRKRSVATIVLVSSSFTLIAADRALAGLMWVGIIALTMPLLMLAVWRWAAAEQRQAERREQLEQAVSDNRQGV